MSHWLLWGEMPSRSVDIYIYIYIYIEAREYLSSDKLMIETGNQNTWHEPILKLHGKLKTSEMLIQPVKHVNLYRAYGGPTS